MLLLSSSCVALCVIICPDPSLRCCASLLLRRRPSFSLCVEAAVVCVAAGRRHEIRRQDDRHPAPLLWLSGDSGFLLILLLIGISKAVVLLGLRLWSPPVASGRLRSPPVASGHLQSTSSLAKRQAAQARWASRVHICHVAKTDDVERVSKMASPIPKRFMLHLKIIRPSGMSHLPLCSARPHGNR